MFLDHRFRGDDKEESGNDSDISTYPHIHRPKP